MVEREREREGEGERERGREKKKKYDGMHQKVVRFELSGNIVHMCSCNIQ